MTPWRTVTVAAGTCVDANVASTAAIVLGEEALGVARRTRLRVRGSCARPARSCSRRRLAGGARSVIARGRRPERATGT